MRDKFAFTALSSPSDNWHNQLKPLFTRACNHKNAPPPSPFFQGRKNLHIAEWASSNVFGAQSAPLVDIGLTYMPKHEWVIAHSAHLSPTPLSSNWIIILKPRHILLKI